jgi:protein-S-isoprenylcysteine O-methyltransferase Ste14
MEMQPKLRIGRVLVTLQFGLLGLLLLLPAGNLPWYSNSWLWIARICAALAVILGAVAFFALRPAFRVLPEPRADAPFIEHGIYRWIRHPMYTAVLLIAASMAIHVRAWSAVFVWCTLAVVLTVKSHYEDALWRAREPQAAEYQQRVGRFLPNWR